MYACVRVSSFDPAELDAVKGWLAEDPTAGPRQEPVLPAGAELVSRVAEQIVQTVDDATSTVVGVVVLARPPSSSVLDAVDALWPVDGAPAFIPVWQGTLEVSAAWKAGSAGEHQVKRPMLPDPRLRRR